MQNEPMPTEGATSDKQEDESALRDAACSVFLLISTIDYEGICVEGVFWTAENAISRYHEMDEENRFPFQSFRVEEWQDGALEGCEIYPQNATSDASPGKTPI